MRSYRDDGEHYAGQLGSEPTPADFLAALWAVTDECWRVLKPTGSMFVNLGDKYAGSGGHNNAGITNRNLPGQSAKAAQRAAYLPATRRQAPDRYNQATDVRPKSLMGLPWRYTLGLTDPHTYRTDNIDRHGVPQWILRAEIVWSKPNGLPESVTDRVRRSHEQWFHLTKQGRYYAAVDEIREAHREPARSTGRIEGHGTDRAVVAGANNGFGLYGDKPRAYNPLGKTPGSVWTVPSEPLAVPDHVGVDHYAAFPQEWPRRLILGWTPPGICTKCGEGRRPVVDKTLAVRNRNVAPRRYAEDPGGETPGDYYAGTDYQGSTEATITGYTCACDVQLAPTRPAVVLDPFAGTGTVPMVARALGRYGIGIDLSGDYLRLARWRITQSGHGAKSEARTNRERQGALW